MTLDEIRIANTSASFEPALERYHSMSLREVAKALGREMGEEELEKIDRMLEAF